MPNYIEKLGPQLPSESGLQKRLRFHQSWYRSEVLGIADFGSTPPPTSRPMGSILPERLAGQGENFTSQEAQDLYAKRRNEGWGVDPVRCTRYLTSSQALTLNFLGPLFSDYPWLIRTLNSILQRSDIQTIEFAAVEHAPAQRSAHLGDMTRIDGFLIFQSQHGYESLALEFKYADRFNSRILQIADNPKYLDLESRTNIWGDFKSAAKVPNINQLIRCHSLGASILLQKTGASRTTLITIHHDRDTKATQIIADYRAHVTDPMTARGLSLSELCIHMSNTADENKKSIVPNLTARYAVETGSQKWWDEVTNN